MSEESIGPLHSLSAVMNIGLEITVSYNPPKLLKKDRDGLELMYKD
jgi:hypothetical protein